MGRLTDVNTFMARPDLARFPGAIATSSRDADEAFFRDVLAHCRP